MWNLQKLMNIEFNQFTGPDPPLPDKAFRSIKQLPSPMDLMASEYMDPYALSTSLHDSRLAEASKSQSGSIAPRPFCIYFRTDSESSAR